MSRRPSQDDMNRILDAATQEHMKAMSKLHGVSAAIITYVDGKTVVTPINPIDLYEINDPEKW